MSIYQINDIKIGKQTRTLIWSFDINRKTDMAKNLREYHISTTADIWDQACGYIK